MDLEKLIVDTLKLNNGKMDYQCLYFHVKSTGCTNKLYNIAIKRLERDNRIKQEYHEIILLE